MSVSTVTRSNSALKIIGQIGEELAANYLQEQGFFIKDRNVYNRWGEIDIVAERKNKIHFVEVKTRIHTRQGMPYEAIRIPKLTHLMRSIQHYILLKQLYRYKMQLDVISIMLNADKSLLNLKVYENIHVDRFY
ncbi:MAG TPA: YraN family protein [Candidatus Woesebacteria bacterium]|nr:YraN family protein [Candidatus Woesebacteria bacterium]